MVNYEAIGTEFKQKNQKAMISTFEEIICIINSNIFTFLTHCEALFLKTTSTNMSEDECFKIIYTDF